MEQFSLCCARITRTVITDERNAAGDFYFDSKGNLFRSLHSIGIKRNGNGKAVSCLRHNVSINATACC